MIKHAQPDQKQVPRYLAPKLTSLGAWQAVTLIVSLPLGPGGNVPLGFRPQAGESRDG